MSDRSKTLRPGIGILANVDVSSINKEGQGVVFDYENRLGKTIEGFVMLWEGEYLAFENRCPHWSVPLGVDGHFLDPTGQFIFCAMHMATFRAEDGKCVSGPCFGAHLKSLEVSQSDYENILTISSSQSGGLSFT